MKKKIAVIIGSLRKESFNRKIAMALMQMAPTTLDMKIVEIGQLPLYNEDEDHEHPPQAWVKFREEIKAFDGVLFATPEYNRSFSAVLKNALDVGSRPYGKSVWTGKPAAVISVSPGAIGGFGANHHLRQCLVAIDLPCMAAPEGYIGGVSKLLDEKGNVSNEATQKFLAKFIDSFAKWVEANTSA